MDAYLTFATLLSVAVVTGIVSPLVILKYTARQKDRDKAEEEEKRRRDRLEDLEARELVREKVEEAARLLEEQDVKRMADARTTKDQLDVIHSLVDGAMTEAMQDQLDMANVNLVLLRAEAARNPENAEAAEAARGMEAKVEKLTARLADRKRQVAVAEEQLRRQEER